MGALKVRDTVEVVLDVAATVDLSLAPGLLREGRERQSIDTLGQCRRHKEVAHKRIGGPVGGWHGQRVPRLEGRPGPAKR